MSSTGFTENMPHESHQADGRLVTCRCHSAIRSFIIGVTALEVIDLFSDGLVQANPVMLSSAQPHPHTYTSTPPALPPTSVPVVRVSEVEVSGPSHVPAVPMMESKPDEETTLQKNKTSAESSPSPKCHCITLILISPSVSAMSSTGSTSFPVVVVPKLSIPAEAYSEHLNRPGGSKDNLCYLCPFRHTNLYCILTHVRKHLEITIGCPICSRGCQNATSLCQHGRDVHGIQIVTSSTSLQDVIAAVEET